LSPTIEERVNQTQQVKKEGKFLGKRGLADRHFSPIREIESPDLLRNREIIQDLSAPAEQVAKQQKK